MPASYFVKQKLEAYSMTQNHKTKKIATLAPYQDHSNGFSWDISSVAFNDPFEAMEKRAAAKEKARAKWNAKKTDGTEKRF